MDRGCLGPVEGFTHRKVGEEEGVAAPATDAFQVCGDSGLPEAPRPSCACGDPALLEAPRPSCCCGELLSEDELTRAALEDPGSGDAAPSPLPGTWKLIILVLISVVALSIIFGWRR